MPHTLSNPVPPSNCTMPHRPPQEYIARQQTERSDIEKKFYAMKDDLITRLQNACAQRDDARAQVGLMGHGNGLCAYG